MSTKSRSRRTLIEDSPPRRSPRLSGNDVLQRSQSLKKSSPISKTRVPTPPRAKKSNILQIPRRETASNQNEFSDEDELFAHASPDSHATTPWQDRLWETLLDGEDKEGKQPLNGSWSKRNLFALFVLIPLIVIFISLLMWNMVNGINMVDGLIDWIWSLVKVPFIALFSISKSHVKLQGQTIDVDLLIDRILANDKFNELISASNPDSEKIMFFAKAKLEAMEKELKIANDALISEIGQKIDTAKSKVEDLKDSYSVPDYEGLKKELSNLKVMMGEQATGDEEITELKLKVQDLIEKHEDLSSKLTKCQKDVPNKQELEEELATALQNALTSNGLITKEDLAQQLAETQQKMLYGLESEVLDKVRNDPIIMDKMASLAMKSGQKFSKDDVVNIVHEALTVYDADKTGLFDFALESAGGTIASIRCTETYDVTQAVYHIMGVPVWWERQNPRKVIQPGSSPGQCWAFKGTHGSVVVKLSNPIFVGGVTLEHIPKSLSPDGNIASAPKQFEVLGLEAIEDPHPIILGNFTYDIDNVKNPVQTFKVYGVQKPLSYVELKVLSNYGHPEYTCLYRFRVHGSIDNTV